MEKIRLNRYLSICGISSRRKADDLISEGRISVNGAVTSTNGTKIDPVRDTVTMNGQVLHPEKKRYIKMNKPRLFVTTLSETEGEKKTITLLMNNIEQRVYPVGRLDYDAEGLLLLTNDGELAHNIHHPGNRVSKVYIAYVRGKPTPGDIDSMSHGRELEDGFAKPDSISLAGSSSVRISFHEGRKHMVKNFMRSFGYPVEKLRRVEIGGVRLDGLPSGRWKDLTVQELRMLRSAAGIV